MPSPSSPGLPARLPICQPSALHLFGRPPGQLGKSPPRTPGFSLGGWGAPFRLLGGASVEAPWMPLVLPEPCGCHYQPAKNRAASLEAVSSHTLPICTLWKPLLPSPRLASWAGALYPEGRRRRPFGPWTCTEAAAPPPGCLQLPPARPGLWLP